MGLSKQQMNQTQRSQIVLPTGAEAYRLWNKVAGSSDLGDLTQAGDLASFIVHCEEHGRRLWGMRLEKLQGFIQSLQGEPSVRLGPWGRRPCSE